MEPDNIGLIMNDLFEPLEGYTTENIFNDLERYIFHDKRDYDLYFNLVRNSKYNYSIEFDRADASHTENSLFIKLSNKCLKGTMTPTEYITSIKEQSQAVIDEYLNIN
jgi:hypothetical protein